MKLHNWAREIKRPDEIVDYPVIRMALDKRLASLMNAIKEDWDALEVAEEEGAILVRVKEPSSQKETIDLTKTKALKTHRNSASMAFGHIQPVSSDAQCLP